MPNPTAAILIIGDEILSGRTQDTNTQFLAAELTKVGVDLKEVRVVPDTADAIVAGVNALRAQYDAVFTSGGIGPTHDDITADAIARAFGLHIDVRADALAILQERHEKLGLAVNQSRLRMARIPDGATLIENPISGAPGFTVQNVHVMAGVPTIFKAMVASVLPTITGGTPLLSQSLRIDRGEGDIAGPLATLAADYPDLSIGSYPFRQDGRFGANIVMRGHDSVLIDAAMARLAALFPDDIE